MLITGASRGLGAALARELAGPGTHLVLVARTSGALEEVDDQVRAQGGQATLVPLDLTQGAGIDQLGGALAERFGHLDVLVAAAAQLGVLSPASHVEPKVFEQTMALNAGANHRLIRSLDPLLRAATAGRAVFITCDQGRKSRAFWATYGASKAALEAMVLTYAAEVRKSPLRVNLVDPGPMGTRLRAQAYPGEDAAKVPSPALAAAAIAPLLEPTCTRHGERIALVDEHN